MTERRASPRIWRRRKVGLILSDGSIEYMWTSDISRGGLQVHTHHVVDMGRQFGIVMAVYDSRCSQFIAVRGQVQVVHKIYDSRSLSFRIGLQLLSFEADGRDIYLHYVRELERNF